MSESQTIRQPSAPDNEKRVGSMRKITLEEHFITADLLKHREVMKRDGLFVAANPGSMGVDKNAIPDPVIPDVMQRGLEVGEKRIQMMDRNGIDMQILSYSAPGVQMLADAAEATRTARATNDFLAETVAKHPSRFAGWATIATQAPEAAADELERAVTELGFKGAMINGHARGEYLDQDKFRVIFERAEALDVPLYLHPTVIPQTLAKYLEGAPDLYDAAWGFAVDTTTHALRIMLSGVLDAYPKTTIVLGHMGELLLAHLWRLDNRFQRSPLVRKEKLLPSEYVKNNFMLTTSGMFSHAALQHAIAVMGADRVMFSVDYPYELMEEGVSFIDTAPISETDRALICYQNAQRLLKLPAFA